MDTLMIHDLKAEFFDLPLDRYRLTFDDGLYSQYYYYPRLKAHPHPLTFFITTSLIREAPARGRFEGRFLTYLKTGLYARKAFIERDLDGFMTAEEVRFLAKQPNVRIGAHSHFHDVILTDVHPRKPKPVSPWKAERFADVPAGLREGLSIRSRLAFQGFEFAQGRLAARTEERWLEFIRRDTELCLNWFERHRLRRPEAYCFPFNEYSSRLIDVLAAFGFREFYAARSARDPRLIGRTDIEALGAAQPAENGPPTARPE
ncbi:MAG: polysaccharide deacetylase family protein [Desulfobacterales bacterium]